MSITTDTAVGRVTPELKKLLKTGEVHARRYMGGSYLEIETKGVRSRVEVRDQLVRYRNEKSRLPDSIGAFAFCIGNRHDSIWQTVVSCLRNRDVIELVWMANNDNDYVRFCDLNHDELRLRVIREGKDALEFLLKSTVCPSNSARMFH